MAMENKSPNNSSPPFLGFPSSEDKMEEPSNVPTTALRISQPRASKSRASLVWQKNIKEEPEDGGNDTLEPDLKEKVIIPTPIKQKTNKPANVSSKQVTKTVIEENSEEEANGTCESTFSTSNDDDPSMSVGNKRVVKKRKPRKSQKTGFKCDQCGRTYKYLRGMRQHKKLECNKEPQFPCPYCPSKYRYRQVVREHVRKHHALAFPKWYATHYVIPKIQESKF